MHLFRVIVPVGDIDAAATFYGVLLGVGGERVSSGRHYFKCVYLSTDEPLEVVQERALAAGATSDAMRGNVGVRAWGERSFYASDPWGNPFCIVQAGSEYTGGACHESGGLNSPSTHNSERVFGILNAWSAASGSAPFHWPVSSRTTSSCAARPALSSTRMVRLRRYP